MPIAKGEYIPAYDVDVIFRKNALPNATLNICVMVIIMVIMMQSFSWMKVANVASPLTAEHPRRICC